MELKFEGEYCINVENESFEAKSAKNGVSRSVWESYSAFANSLGGCIVLGLDEGEEGALRVGGVKDPDKIVSEIWDTVDNPRKVSCNVLCSKDVRVIEYEGKSLVIIDVPRADRHDCPVYVNDSMNGGSFRRNGPNDYKCTRPEIAGMIRSARRHPTPCRRSP